MGAVGAFCLTRYLFQDWAKSKFGQHKLLRKWHQALNSNPFSLVLSLRFAPIAPFNIINFLLALTLIDLKIYTIATSIGVIPGTIAYTWLGASGKTALQGSDASSFIFASIFLVLLSVSPLLFKRWWK
ncbi:TVP38/TMEM64 family protein [Okeania sp. SIO1I7]|uniref:TVP38/TMEM64 family protein n=1 Tax=Okeania sp. SIO1I7 TaxID=2607772 RepID=UPI0025D2412E|nr:VTT domain-containing protein [Okeania sp. SIO1I7]